MKQYFKLLLMLLSAFNFGCAGKHLINDKKYLSVIENSFDERRIIASNRETELFSVFDQKITREQKEALKFLYAFMPLSDLADYQGDFFLANTDIALKSRQETIWGKEIPDEVFLHYVLPSRINNENLDSFRIVYFDEIMDRVKEKDITEAALEINHWCHEKVSYMPADSRTSSPMNTVLSARGRCGEESTFTVAALRTAGIPARQVYTPRWAHSDDNHAWVEVWINGEWHYMGACEPEPVLDRGWFTEPARRAMLVHTKSFGAATDDENSIMKYRNYSLVNSLSRYAVTKKIYVKVVDRNNLPIKDAVVEYQLYNYSEFYPLSMVPTNDDGISMLETGLGDLMIWARLNNEFAFKKISVTETDTLTLILEQNNLTDVTLNLDLNVPVVKSPITVPSDELIEKNSERINYGNTIRQKYIDTWIKPEESIRLAQQLGIDTAGTVDIMARSMGNYDEIRSFLIDTPDSLKNLAVSLLEILPDKDLRDTKRNILSDHLINSSEYQKYNLHQQGNLFLQYILNPRVADELLVDWRGYFRTMLPCLMSLDGDSVPSLIIDYINENIRIANDENYYKTPITPVGVNELKVSDEVSRSILFVSICRTFGIPARLEPGRNIPQYFFKNRWNDVYFNDQEKAQSSKGFIKLYSDEKKPVPEYYIHFTLARFDNGRYNTLEYDYNKKINDFNEELALQPGKYMLVTGNRINDSKILSSITFFDLAENEHKKVKVAIRKDAYENVVYGTVDLENIISLIDENNIYKDEILKGSVVILWVEPDMEPTKHIFNDLPLLKNELNDWGGYFLFLSDSSSGKNGLDPENLKDLPANTLFGFDNELKALHNLVKTAALNENRMPVVLLADNKGQILFISTGYRIGIGELILKYAR